MDTSTFQELHWLLDIIQSADIGIVVVDKDLNIEIFNRFMQVHSNIVAEKTIGQKIIEVFPYLNDEWFTRRVNSVFELGIPVYTTFQQRDSLFDFRLRLPIHHANSQMYQNTTFVPLRSSTDEVEKVAIIVYDETAMAISQGKLQEAKDELLILSRTDALTTLNNRGYWEERLKEEFKRNKRSTEPVSLVIFDIDHFKRINDTYGHSVGDDAIRYIAEALLYETREVDVSGRYGGEEFTVILPNTDVEGATIFCERFRERVAANVVKSGGHEVSFTISLGVCLLGESIDSAHSWLVNADAALYEAKESGRNKTVIYKPAVAV
ncbi:GGDEF domain-containing protein [Dasania marina]|uniref:GGDEF domain-containing protein n=1 Tax=Dasania marina TaxID=471499 RepID=UPI0030DB16E9|tara:strand:- start:94597 stop:95562 length:966 start_codon:yes stop_codon:yes gene_type:complete